MSLLRATPVLILMLALIPTDMAAASTELEVEPSGIYAKVQVLMRNNYPGAYLTAHCKSGDTDFGETGGGLGVVFTAFAFKPNLWRTTHYWCTVSRKPGQELLQFTIYDFKRDASGRCVRSCNWTVRPDGVYGINESTGKEDLFFPWT